MDCRRCNGKGLLVIKTGKPDSARNTHEPYRGVWCISKVRCYVCYGAGVERDKQNPMAGMRIHLDADGRTTKRERIENDNDASAN